jgi:putative oxidoreductase
VNPIRLLARPMLASMFIMGGLDSLRNAQAKAPAAEPVTEPLGEAVPAIREAENADLVRINGAAQVAGGTLLAIGRFPRLASAVLAATLVPTTLAGHRFWEEEDPQARTGQQIHFFKNVSMLGGLMIAAMDTEGRPGLAWRAGHALEHAEQRVERTRREARLATKLARAEARSATRGLTGRSRREARLAGKLAKAESKRRLTPDVADLTRGVRALSSSD